MSGREVLGCVAAVVSAFHTAADTLETIKERKEKKKRKKEKEVEELIEIRLLHKSLLEGATQCRTCSEDRHRRYGPAFDVGDGIATSQLKDVVISLQSEVIQALNIAKAVENGPIDLTTLHEASVTNRRDAIQAMDELCRRVMDSVYDGEGYDYQNFPSPRPQFAYPPLQRPGSSESLSSRTETIPSYYGGSKMSQRGPKAYPSFQRMQSTRQDNNMMVHRGPSQVSHASSSGWLSPHSPQYQRRQNDMRAFHRSRVPENDEYESHEIQVYADLDHMSEMSIQDSAMGSEMGQRRHRASSSVNSSGPPEYPRASFASDESVPEQQHKDLEKMGFPQLRAQTITRIEQPKEYLKEISPSSRKQSTTRDEQLMVNEQPNLVVQKQLPSPMRKPVNSQREQPPEEAKDSSPSTRTQSIASNKVPTIRPDNDLSSDSEPEDESSRTSRAASPAASGQSRTASSAASQEVTTESIESMARAIYAPEVVTKEFESMLSHPNLHLSAPGKRPLHLNTVHPVLRKPFNYVDNPASPVMDNVWLPLPRPARHNNYHGFCKGAWQIRKSVQEGLSIQMIPNDKGVTVPHWTCKICHFRSKASNQSALPDQIFFNQKCAVRYRWLFLAKSHVAAVGSFNKPENYSYGCMFCAAEGRTTATYEKLDPLMLHIQAKHKTAMMTPETKEKTRSIIGGTPDRNEEWDINLPYTKPRSVPGGPVGEFVVSAVTGITKYQSTVNAFG